MDHPNIDLVMSVYGAYMTGDTELLQAGMSPDIVLHSSGTDPTAGDHAGIPAVLAYLAGDDHMEDYALEVVDVLASDTQVAVVARSSGRRGEATIVNPFVQLLRIDDGKIVEVWNYMWDQAAIAAFMAAPV